MKQSTMRGVKIVPPTAQAHSVSHHSTKRDSAMRVRPALSVLLTLLVLPSLGAAQESLPFPPAPSPSTAGPTIAESRYKEAGPVSHLPAGAPNILVIMLDDVGPALPETYGGPIHTPTLSRVAGEGISFNRFHNAAMCSPTRAALLSGRNHHRSGFGQIAELANDWDGYTGHWPATTASVAKVLGYYGYNTAAFGKWHNTPAEQTTAQGPYDRWPAGRLVGFDYFYGFLAGESSQWEPAIVKNTTRIPTPEKENYHFTEDIADEALSWMRRQNAIAPDQPFFLYWAPGASHGPAARQALTTVTPAGPQATVYRPSLIKSATRSPIIMVVAFVLARIQSGMIEASATQRPSSPWTRPD